MSIDQRHVYEISLEADSDRQSFFKSSTLVTQTGFFRLKDLYDSLETIVLPKLSQTEGKIQIWSAGCSDGREPYSVAMTIERWQDKPGKKQLSYAIRASDINDEMIRIARRNRYDITRVELNKLQEFTDYCELHGPLTVQVRNDAARKIQFINEDIFSRTGYQKKYNLIICTNVMFYYEMEYRKKNARSLIELIAPNGFLYIESVGSRFLRSCGLQRVNSSSNLYQLTDPIA